MNQYLMFVGFKNMENKKDSKKSLWLTFLGFCLLCHVLYDTPCHLLLQLMNLIDVLIDFLTKMDFEENLLTAKLPDFYDYEKVSCLVDTCLLNSVNLFQKYD